MAEVIKRAEAAAEIKTVILSLEESSDFDSTALDALLEGEARLKRSGRTLLLARVKDGIKDVLRSAGAGRLDEACFWSVADAAAAAGGKLVRVGGVEPPRA